jgi:putative membrane protein
MRGAVRAGRRGVPVNLDAGDSNMTLILVWILNAVALLVVAYLLPGITVASFGSALIAALVLGLLNMLVKPVLVLLTLPITIVTLGLFLIILNALLFWFAGSILKGFQVNGFWWAVIGAILYSIISGLLSMLLAS